MSDIKYDIKSVKILLNMKDEIIARQSAEIVAKDELIRELVEAVGGRKMPRPRGRPKSRNRQLSQLRRNGQNGAGL